MSDFASVVGGTPGDTIPIASVDPDGAFAYFWNTGTADLDLGAQGDAWDSQGSNANNTVAGGTGDDTMAAGAGSDLLTGQDGDDIIDAGAGDNTVAGGQGADTLLTGSGSDFVDGGVGNDVVQAGAGSDQIFGSDGDDSLAGEAGVDSLYGGSGNDTLLGGADDDYLSGASGNDFLSGDGGNDTLFGGSGTDVFFFDSNFGNDVIKDIGSGDQIWLTSNINNSGITSASDVTNFLGGGTDPGTGLPFTTITIGSDVIRIDNMDQSTFEANISTWVKIQP